jgi:hypothetical protein
MKFRLLIVLCIGIAFVGCTATKLVNIAYSPNKLTEKQARSYIEEMHYATMYTRNFGVVGQVGHAPKTLNITDESIKATYERIIESKYAINSNIETIIKICYFKQITSIDLGKDDNISPYQIFSVQIQTRSGIYYQGCNSEALAKNYIDAIEYFRQKSQLNN